MARGRQQPATVVYGSNDRSIIKTVINAGHENLITSKTPLNNTTLSKETQVVLNYINRLRLTTIGASLAVAMASAFPAHSQTLDVEFFGNIAPVTSVDTIQSPTPIPSGGDNGGSGLPTLIETLEPTIIRLQTTGPLSVTASEPIPRGTPAPAGTQYISFLSDGNTDVENGIPLFINEIGEVDLGVRIRVESPSPFAPGQYNYDVVLTLIAL